MFFDYIKSLFLKDGRTYLNIDRQLCLTLSKWISWDKSSINHIKDIVGYALYITPQHFYYLLYCVLPNKKPPFLKKIVVEKPKENKLLNKVQWILGWSSREMEYNKDILNKTILVNSKYWKQELGIK